MAHFAQLDANKVVTQVIVVNNSVLVEPEPVVINGVMYTNGESEARGITFCKDTYGADTDWAQTSYNGSFRGKYAAIGDTFDPVTNMFISPVTVPEGLPTMSLTALETQAEPAITTQEPVGLTSTDIPALTSEQISGL